MTHEPPLDLWRLVGGNIVDDEMDVKIFGHAAIDQDQEVAELGRPVSFGHVSNDVPADR